MESHGLSAQGIYHGVMLWYTLYLVGGNISNKSKPLIFFWIFN